jgi:hypothetical protein
VEAVRALYIERSVEHLLHDTRAGQMFTIKKRYNIPDEHVIDEQLKSDFFELMERRNLLAHTGGRVSQAYVRACKSSRMFSNVKVGDIITVDHDYLSAACDTIIKVAVIAATKAWRACMAGEAAKADNCLAFITYSFLTFEEWRLAQELLRFATKLKPSSEQRLLVFTINYAQTFKWLDQEDECLRVLAQQQWEAKDDAFQLSYAVLIDDFDQAADLMRQMRDSPRKVQRSAFEHWPIYRQFRLTEQYAAAYREMWGSDPPPAERESATNFVDGQHVVDGERSVPAEK